MPTALVIESFRDLDSGATVLEEALPYRAVILTFP